MSKKGIKKITDCETKKPCVEGAFVKCYRPYFTKNGDIYGYDAAAVRLSEIKNIDSFNEEMCTFYTYKDVWFACNLSIKELISEINNYLVNEIFKNENHVKSNYGQGMSHAKTGRNEPEN